MAKRKARAKRRAAEQRAARERRRDLDRDAAARRAVTAAATAARRGADARRMGQHDGAVLPLVRELREARATWQEIADWLDDAAVSPPGGRGGGWSATAVWRMARRHGLAGRRPSGRDEDTEPPVELEGGRVKMPDGRVVRPIGPRQGVVQHDELVLSTLRTMRRRGASWREIAEHLEAEGVLSPGRRDAHIRARGWTAGAAWRIGRRHGIA